jgi:hypothetical protein
LKIVVKKITQNTQNRIQNTEFQTLTVIPLLRGVRGVYNPEYSKKPERKLKQNFQLKNHSLPSITTSKL